MRKHKSVVAILLAVMMIFTFMPTMAFADDAVDTATKHLYTGVTWSADYHTADVAIKDVTSDGRVIKTQTIHFDDFDEVNGVEASKKEYDNHAINYFVVGDDSSNGGSSPENVTYELKYATVAKDGNDYSWKIEGTVVGWGGSIGNLVTLFNYYTYDDEAGAYVSTPYEPEKPALGDELLFKTVIDASWAAEHNGFVASNYDSRTSSLKVDAGDYSAWYATKDNKEPYNANPAKISSVNNWSADKETQSELFSVEYPAYDAYEYATDDKGKAVDKELEVKVTFNENAIKAYYGNSVLVSNAVGTIKLIPQVGTPDNRYFTEFELDMEKTPVKDDAGKTLDEEYIYDGAAHGVKFAHMPKNVVVKYFVTEDEDMTANKIKDADWTDAVSLKDAGDYNVFVKFTAEKSNTSYIFHDWCYIEPFTVDISAKQAGMTTEYGKLTAENLEAAIKGLFDYGTTPDSQDKIAEVFSKYLVVGKLFTDAGYNDITASIDTIALAKDKDLFAAVRNYDFSDTDKITLTITKVDNDVEISAPDKKTFKASKKTKKLAKNKSFTISATSRFGNVSFSKLSGNNKIKVSKSGKITVKKGLKKGKTYKVKVKALAQGTANYAQASAKKTIAIKIK